jgi:hypothetical protein
VAFRRGIGLGDVERNRARGQRVEDRLGQRGQAQAAFDEAAGLAEAFGDPVDVGALADEMLRRGILRRG